MIETKCRICKGFGDSLKNISVTDKDDFVKLTCESCHGFGYYLAPRLPSVDPYLEAKRKAVETLEDSFRPRLSS